LRTYKTILLALAALVILAMAPAVAQAQRHEGRGPGLHVGVVVGGSYGFGPSYQYPWYPYPYNYPYPYGYGYPPYGPYGPYPGYYDDSGALRIEVKPKQADVYVDGYHAGIVDDFDGIFQRLHVRPGGHEIVLFLEGYRTVEETVYLNPRQTQTIKLSMERLRSGETSGPRPVPPPPVEQPNQPGQYGPPVRPGQPPAPGTIQAGPPQPMPGRTPPPPPEQQGGQLRNGSLSIRVQPADAEIWVDGEIWHGDRPRALIVVQLAEGKHKLELKKAGFDTFSADVMVRPGQTTTVNVTLTKGH
jgi:hypothetical protein